MHISLEKTRLIQADSVNKNCTNNTIPIQYTYKINTYNIVIILTITHTIVLNIILI